VAQHVASRVFAPGPTGRVGIEIEWVTTAAPGIPNPAAMRATLPDPFPGGSRLTFEPGGQLELSGPAYPGLADALAAMASDTAAARAALMPLGVSLVGTGLDPGGARDRVLDAPRYRAMEEYFDTRWPAGRTMMRNTASVQVNLEVGEGEEVAARWRRAHDLGPLLVAAFANSPFDAAGHATGWCSTRFAVWEGIDPSRTGAAYREGEDPCASFTRYALDAGVMMIWRDRPGTDDARVPATRLRFGDWVDHGHPLGHPTVDDLDYHLTTLFPPVRPRGWLELRMIDALPEEWWPRRCCHPSATAGPPALATDWQIPRSAPPPSAASPRPRRRSPTSVWGATSPPRSTSSAPGTSRGVAPPRTTAWTSALHTWGRPREHR
jgi:glutamate--cysteine ligase